MPGRPSWLASFGRGFSDLDQRRGQVYQREGRVRLVEVAASGIRAEVSGGLEYQVELRWRDPSGKPLGLRCSCPRFEESARCKHIVAVLTELDAAEYPVPGALGESLARGRKTNGNGAGTAAEPPSRPAPASWQYRLDALQSRLVPEPPRTPGKGVDEAQVWFAIEVEASRRNDRLLVSCLWRTRTAAGHWGPLGPLPARMGRDELPTAAEQRLVALLRELAPPATWWGSDARTAVPLGFAIPVLAELAAIERLMIKPSSERPSPATPLAVATAPWEPVLEVEERGDDGATLRGMVRGEGGARPIADAVLILDGRLLVFEDLVVGIEPPLAGGAARAEADFSAIEVPAGEVGALMVRLEAAAGPRVIAPVHLLPREEHHSPVMRLSIDSGGVDPEVAQLAPEALYDGVPVALASPGERVSDPPHNRLLQRDLAAERAGVRALLAAEGPLADANRVAERILIAREHLAEVVEWALGLGWLVVSGDGRRVRSLGTVKASISTAREWFRLHLEGQFDEQAATTDELLATAARGDGWVALDDGTVGLLPGSWRRQIAALGLLAQGRADGQLRFGATQALLLDGLVGATELDADRAFEALRERLTRSADQLQPVDPPPGFVGTLRDYQRAGLGWLEHLMESGFGGCLADDMGLGKTVQVLALLARRHAGGNGQRRRPTLVVAPKSVVHNWLEEAARFAPQLATAEYGGPRRQQTLGRLDEIDVLVTTYQLVRRDVERLRRIDFDLLVLDEAQAVKNRNTQGHRALRALSVEHRLALTGTPVENHLGELWALLELLNPGLLGRLPMTTGIDLGEAELEALGKAVRPFLLRRVKGEVLRELPSRTEQTLTCTMKTAQRRIYDQLRQVYRDSLLGRVERDGIAKSKIYVLEALLRLRQAACHPGLVDKRFAKAPSAKLDLLLEHLVELRSEGHKALVFSQFTSLLSIVEERLDAAAIPWSRLDGSTRDRAGRVAEFRDDPDRTAFLVSLKAGGTGLNLTAASYVFLLDPWWNPAVEAQAIDRTHRIGQERPVMAYRLVVEGTVEERILALQERKRALADAILSQDASVARSLSLEDLELLLG